MYAIAFRSLYTRNQKPDDQHQTLGESRHGESRDQT